MICRECGGLLHVGLRHECQPVTTIEEGLRRVRRAQRSRATFAAAGLGDPIQSSGPIRVTPIPRPPIQSPPWHDEWPPDTWDDRRTQAMVDAGLAWPAPQKPIRVVATVGTAIACRVAGCGLHNSDNPRASDEQVSA